MGCSGAGERSGLIGGTGHELGSPREVRNALAYVLFNGSKHGRGSLRSRCVCVHLLVCGRVCRSGLPHVAGQFVEGAGRAGDAGVRFDAKWTSSCGSWLRNARRTSNQRRKPLLGSGAAVPIGFAPTCLEGRLLLATDGLVKYAPAERLADAASIPELACAAEALVACLRLPSGGLQDDAAFVLAG
jgi:hypothetical protein